MCSDRYRGSLRKMAKSLVVVDYGVGNVFSVVNALKMIGESPVLSAEPSVVSSADRLILPGVGSFSAVMRRLQASGLKESINTFIRSDRPFLGICVGMQVLMTASFEFGCHEGLNYINGTVDRIPDIAESGASLKVPHIGWERLQCVNSDFARRAGFRGLDQSYFYFVHSFQCNPDSHENLVATVNSRDKSLCAMVGSGNIIGVQFHPERSGPDGLRFLKMFVE